MKIKPVKNQIVGATIEITLTDTGIVLPDRLGQKFTKFAHIWSVGPDVTDYKVGDVVLPYKSNEVHLRDGFECLIFEDKEVISFVKDLPLNRLSVGGKPLKPGEDGKFSLPQVE